MRLREFQFWQIDSFEPEFGRIYDWANFLCTGTADAGRLLCACATVSAGASSINAAPSRAGALVDNIFVRSARCRTGCRSLFFITGRGRGAAAGASYASGAPTAAGLTGLSGPPPTPRKITLRRVSRSLLRVLAVRKSCAEGRQLRLVRRRPLRFVRPELFRLWGREAAEEAIERLLKEDGWKICDWGINTVRQCLKGV